MGERAHMTSSSVASLPIVPELGIAAPAGRQAPPRSGTSRSQNSKFGGGKKQELSAFADQVIR